MCHVDKQDMRIERKLVFIDRELEKLSALIDEAVEDDVLCEDTVWDMRDCIINVELQIFDLKELFGGIAVTK